jgi:hypothetical protein
LPGQRNLNRDLRGNSTRLNAFVRQCPTAGQSRPHHRETIRLPSGEKATLRTPLSCPLKGSGAGLPSSIHSRTVPSSPPQTMHVPSGGKATLLTPPSCPLKGSAAGVPFEHPQADGAVPATGDDVRAVGREGHAIDLADMPLKGSAAGLPSNIHSRTVPSSPAETMRLPSGEKGTLRV